LTGNGRAPRVVIGMYDGWGPEYLEQSEMPVVRDLMARGVGKIVDAIMPTVTNVNNVSICCGEMPSVHGITGNSYYDEARHAPEYMEDGGSILVPTMIQRARQQGVKSALLTCKKKTISLLGMDAEIAVAAEAAPADLVAKHGAPGDIYSCEINYWLWRVAVDLLQTRPDIGLVYVHTTDYPMHMWPAEAPESRAHLKELDRLLGLARAAAPDAAFYLTADHGMNGKTRCWDLAKACAERGLALRFALSAERDRYVKHHRTFGGTAWVWLASPADRERARDVILSLRGIEEVLDRDVAAQRFHLLPERIGDLMVTGDRDTVFGELPGASESEELAPGYRSHGSLHEARVPLVAYDPHGGHPPADAYRANADLVRHLFR
jgi:phosphonoacetate hydrolase